jgi:hypothetical protein
LQVFECFHRFLRKRIRARTRITAPPINR